MILDKEGHEIILTDIPNGHILVLGKSGSGKTYFLCRKIEEDLAELKRVFIIDYSGSYTDSEMKKNHFEYLSQVEVWNPFEKELVWELCGQNSENVVADSLIKILGIRSFYQKKLIVELVDRLLEDCGQMNICMLVEAAESAIETKDNADEQKNLVHLLNRLYPYRDINVVWRMTDSSMQDAAKPIVVLELSQFSQQNRKFLMEFFSLLLWEEVRMWKSRADVFVFDEFQHMDLCEDSTIDTLLREGRKFGVSTYLSSQFLGRKGEEVRETFMQAGNYLFFSPTETEIRTIASWISLDAKKEWQSILGDLSRGEAVLKGNYRIKNKANICTVPIICTVRREEICY